MFRMICIRQAIALSCRKKLSPFGKMSSIKTKKDQLICNKICNMPSVHETKSYHHLAKHTSNLLYPLPHAVSSDKLNHASGRISWKSNLSDQTTTLQRLTITPVVLCIFVPHCTLFTNQNVISTVFKIASLKS